MDGWINLLYDQDLSKINDWDLLKMNDSNYCEMIRLMIDEWFLFSMRFIEDRWLRWFIEDEWFMIFHKIYREMNGQDLLKMNDFKIFHEIYCMCMIRIYWRSMIRNFHEIYREMNDHNLFVWTLSTLVDKDRWMIEIFHKNDNDLFV
jgi:hypothetical protein